MSDLEYSNPVCNEEPDGVIVLYSCRLFLLDGSLLSCT